MHLPMKLRLGNEITNGCCLACIMGLAGCAVHSPWLPCCAGFAVTLTNHLKSLHMLSLRLFYYCLSNIALLLQGKSVNTVASCWKDLMCREFSVMLAGWQYSCFFTLTDMNCETQNRHVHEISMVGKLYFCIYRLDWSRILLHNTEQSVVTYWVECQLSAELRCSASLVAGIYHTPPKKKDFTLLFHLRNGWLRI